MIETINRQIEYLEKNPIHMFGIENSDIVNALKEARRKAEQTHLKLGIEVLSPEEVDKFLKVDDPHGDLTCLLKLSSGGIEYSLAIRLLARA